LAKHTGAKLNLVPLSGGRNTYAGVKSGEMDIGALPFSGIAKRSKTFRTLVIFDNKTYSKELMGQLYNAPLANKHFGMKLPPLLSARAFAIKTEAIEKYPDRFKILEDTAKKVFSDADYKAAVEKGKAPWELIQYGNRQECAEYVKSILEVGEEFRDMLKGKA